MRASVTGIRKRGDELTQGVYVKEQIMEDILGTGDDGADITVAHTSKYPTLGNSSITMWLHILGGNYTAGDTMELKLYKREELDGTVVYSTIGTFSADMPNIQAGTAGYVGFPGASALMSNATHYSVSGTITVPGTADARLVVEKGSDSSSGSAPSQITGTTDSEWIVVNAKQGSVTLDCTSTATTAGYVEVTIDKAAVDSGGTAVAEIWENGTITNTSAHAQFGPIYAIRFVVTASTGHEMFVQV